MTTPLIIPPVLTGLTFGAALTLSSVASPSVILSQLALRDSHMLLTFLSASSLSALIIHLTNSSKYASLSARKDSSVGLWGKFDGNILGGALQGIGMALSGACPGTVLVQVAGGLGRPGRWVLAGGVLGGVVFVGWDRRRAKKEYAGKGKNGEEEKYTVMQKTGLSTANTVLGYEAVLGGAMLAMNAWAPRAKYLLHPVVGGLLIGSAQAMSVLVSKKTLGVSSAYEDVGKWFWSVLDGKSGPGISNLLFAAGVAAGARATMSYVPATIEVLEESVNVSPLAAAVGGFAMIFGARLAGGCTSGHGISGMATMSISSFVTVTSMFAAGIATALLL
jgi:uncharacterized membrane protein YedE/YeeE